MVLHMATGNTTLDTAIEQLIHAITRHFPTLHLSFYLHGSWATDGARLGSDVDILALSREVLTEDQWRYAEHLAAEIGAQTGCPLDFHLMELDTLIADPWIDLRRTGLFLWGIDIRPQLPEPTRDALARETVLVSPVASAHISMD